MVGDTSSVLGPLRGVKVLDLSRHIPGGRCTLLLNDLGADVIKVESPGGDAVRGYGRSSFVNEAINRGKRSMTLNLKSAAAADVLRRMVETADVLIESARPGAMERLGLGYEALSAINPRLVWCSLVPFGDGSPLADDAGHELNFLGYTGLMATMATMLPEPGRTGAPFALSTTFSGVMAAFGILAALLEREQTGTGSRVETSIVDSGTWLISDLVVGSQEGITSLPHDTAQVSTYMCADGRMVTVSAWEPSTWVVLVDLLGLPQLREPMPTTPQEHAQVVEQFVRAFATRPSSEWVELFQGARASVGPVNEIPDLFADPHVLARGTFVERGGKTVVANPIRITGPDGPLTDTAPGGAPGFGAHTTEVLVAAGYTSDEIESLRSAGAL